MATDDHQDTTIALAAGNASTDECLTITAEIETETETGIGIGIDVMTVIGIAKEIHITAKTNLGRILVGEQGPLLPVGRKDGVSRLMDADIRTETSRPRMIQRKKKASEYHTLREAVCVLTEAYYRQESPLGIRHNLLRVRRVMSWVVPLFRLQLAHPPFLH